MQLRLGGAWISPGDAAQARDQVFERRNFNKKVMGRRHWWLRGPIRLDTAKYTESLSGSSAEAVGHQVKWHCTRMHHTVGRRFWSTTDECKGHACPGATPPSSLDYLAIGQLDRLCEVDPKLWSVG